MSKLHSIIIFVVYKGLDFCKDEEEKCYFVRYKANNRKRHVEHEIMSEGHTDL